VQTHQALAFAPGRIRGVQGRFASVDMDETPLAAALRYVAPNPVEARLAELAQDWPWSSTATLVAGGSTRHVDGAPALARTGDFGAFLASGGYEAR
jgi:putative transposase